MRRDDFSFGFDLLLPTVLGLVVIGPIAFALLALVIWFFIFSTRVRSRRQRGLAPVPILGTITTALIFLGIIYTAHSYQPVKTVEIELERKLSFPQLEMPLGDLGAWASRHSPTQRILASYQLAEADRNRMIQLPSRELTVREYLKVLDEQIRIDWKFRHCGNGYSILQGGDCCFGLHIRQRNTTGPFFTVSDHYFENEVRLFHEINEND